MKIKEVLDTGTWVLRDRTHREMCEGDPVTSFRGEARVLRGGAAPHTLASTGKVWTTRPDGSRSIQHYPSVYELRWVFLEDTRILECGEDR